MIRDLSGTIFRKCYKLMHPAPVDIQGLYTEVPQRPGLIPNVVYQTWKKPELPSVHARGVRAFRKQNPDFSFRFFDDEAMAAYMKAHYNDHPIREVFESLTVPAAKVDVWRYCLLFREGGVYCDIDSSLNVPIRTILDPEQQELLAFEGGLYKNDVGPGTYGTVDVFHQSAPSESVRTILQEPDHTVLNWFLAFAPGHPILEVVISLIVQNFPFYRDREFKEVWRAVVHATGPLILTQAVWKVIESKRVVPCQMGIDFDGHGIFKIPGSGDRYSVSQHYIHMENRKIVR